MTLRGPVFRFNCFVCVSIPGGRAHRIPFV